MPRAAVKAGGASGWAMGWLSGAVLFDGGNAAADFDLAWLPVLRDLAHEIDVQQAKFEVGADHFDGVGELEAALREEIQRVLDDAFTDKELNLAKLGYLQSRALARAQDGNLVGMLTQALYFDRTLEWDSEFEARVQNLTVEDVNAAVRRHLDLNKMTFVKAGDFAGVESPSF